MWDLFLNGGNFREEDNIMKNKPELLCNPTNYPHVTILRLQYIQTKY